MADLVEIYTWNGNGNCALESSDRSLGNFFRSELLGARLSSCDHVRLEKSSLKEDVMVIECLVDKCQHSFCHLLSTVEVVVSVGQNLQV